MKTITLIVPAYNEEKNIQKGVLDKIGNYVLHHPDFKEVIIVDDGSTDATKAMIQDQYLPEFPFFRLIENNHGGKAQALITGIQAAKTDVVMFTDIDLATPIEEAKKLTEKAHDFDIVIGSRSDNREGAPLTRKIMAMGGIFIRSYVIGIKGIHDTQCGFKLFNTKKAQRVIQHLVVFQKEREVQGPSVSALFDVEFLFVAKKLGYSIAEVPVVWKHVETRNVNFFKDSFESLRDIARMKLYELQGKYSTSS